MIETNADFIAVIHNILNLTKTCGMHLFKVMINGKLVTTSIHENVDICLFIILFVANVYTIILTWQSNEDSNFTQSFLIDIGLRGFIFGGLFIDIFVLIWNFINASKILKMISNFQRFDNEVQFSVYDLNVNIICLSFKMFQMKGIGVIPLNNERRKISVLMITATVCEFAFGGISIYVCKKFNGVSEILRFCLSYALFTGCFTGCLAFHNFLNLNAHRRFRLINRYLW